VGAFEECGLFFREKSSSEALGAAGCVAGVSSAVGLSIGSPQSSLVPHRPFRFFLAPCRRRDTASPARADPRNCARTRDTTCRRISVRVDAFNETTARTDAISARCAKRDDERYDGDRPHGPVGHAPESGPSMTDLRSHGVIGTSASPSRRRRSFAHRSGVVGRSPVVETMRAFVPRRTLYVSGNRQLRAPFRGRLVSMSREHAIVSARPAVSAASLPTARRRPLAYHAPGPPRITTHKSTTQRVHLPSSSVDRFYTRKFGTSPPVSGAFETLAGLSSQVALAVSEDARDIRGPDVGPESRSKTSRACCGRATEDVCGERVPVRIVVIERTRFVSQPIHIENCDVRRIRTAVRSRSASPLRDRPNELRPVRLSHSRGPISFTVAREVQISSVLEYTPHKSYTLATLRQPRTPTVPGLATGSLRFSSRHQRCACRGIAVGTRTARVR